MAKTCGNCLRSVTSLDFLEAERIENGECWCTLKDEYYLNEKEACDRWRGDIKLPKNDKK